MLDDKVIADRIQDGADDAAATVKVWWTKPRDRAHGLAGAVTARIPSLVK